MIILYVSGFSIQNELTHATASQCKELYNTLSSLPNINMQLTGEVLSSEKYYSEQHNFAYYFKRLIKWPSRDPNAEALCYEKIKKHETCSDIMLICHQPYEAVRASIRYKKKHPNKKMYLCLFDPIANEVDRNLAFLWKCLFPLASHAEMQAFRKYDGVFHMECNRLKYLSKKYQRFYNKFYFIDFLEIHNLNNPASEAVEYNNQQIKMIYSGKLWDKVRTPYYLVDVFKGALESVNLKMEFYSQGSCEDYLTEVSRRDSHFRACGYIPKAELDAVMEEADAYVNIGNKYSSMLPSKLLTYFERGKPVIHVSNQEGDACLPYMEKYPLGLVIRESDPVEVSARKVTEFLRSTYRQRVSSEEICRIFYKNTPEWSAREIVKVIERDMKQCK